MTKLRTVPEAAEILRLKEVTVRQWMHRGKVAFIRLGRRTLIEDAEICRLVLAGSVPRKCCKAPSPAPALVDFKLRASGDDSD